MCLSLRSADRGNDPVGKMSGAGPGATADKTNLKVKLSVYALVFQVIETNEGYSAIQ